MNHNCQYTLVYTIYTDAPVCIGEVRTTQNECVQWRLHIEQKETSVEEKNGIKAVS